MERRFHELEAIILRAKQQAVREDEEVKRVQLGRTQDLVLPGLIILFVLYRTMRTTVTTQICRSSVSPVGIPSTHALPCATWSVAMPRSGTILREWMVWGCPWAHAAHRSVVWVVS